MITTDNSKSRKPSHVVFHVTGKEDKTRWTRIGAAWAHNRQARAHAVSSRLSRVRPTNGASWASLQKPSTKAAHASSRRSAGSNTSSGSRYAARRQSGTSHPSSHSQPLSPWSNPSTRP